MSAKHRIADVHFDPEGPCWLVCTDGHRIAALSPDTLNKEWRRHGGGTYTSSVLGPNEATAVTPCAIVHAIPDPQGGVLRLAAKVAA